MEGWIHLVIYCFMIIGVSDGILLIVLYNLFAGLTVICMGVVGVCLNGLLYEADKVKKNEY